MAFSGVFIDIKWNALSFFGQKSLCVLAHMWTDSVDQIVRLNRTISTQPHPAYFGTKTC